MLSALESILPAELKQADPLHLESAWDTWIMQHDREVRDRLARGDEDTLVNWLLLGSSFTSRPRSLRDPGARPGTAQEPSGASAEAVRLAALIAARARDLVTALAAPGIDERRLFARRLLERKGFRFDTPADRARIEGHLAGEVSRVAREQEGHARDLQAARRLRDTSEEFVARSRLFRARGLSLDTSILPNAALEQSLQQIRAQELLTLGSVRRVAVIGPGLDFSDKNSGLDFYPQQTIQPFALLDTLRRLKLADPSADVEIVTLDLSSRVNDHLRRARDRARQGSPYDLFLPLELGLGWKPDVVDYWNRFGDQIGVQISPPKPPAIGSDIRVRAIRIPSRVVLQFVPKDVNIVAQRIPGASFDLIVATNVFVYYDVLDQSLALANIEAMLHPGGILLANNAVLELPSSRMRSVGYTTVQYSSRPDDGDHIIWYRRIPE